VGANEIAYPTRLLHREALMLEMVAFEDNVLHGAFHNLHARIVLHLLMSWMVVFPKETVCLMMSIIGTQIWEQQRPIVRKNNVCDCNDLSYTPGGGCCRETVEGA
jgi:hypothetical protein